MICKRCGTTYQESIESIDNVLTAAICFDSYGHVWPELCEPVSGGPYESAQPCGCDEGAKWTCTWHRDELSSQRLTDMGGPEESR